ncbi:MAG TPA: LPS assembly lipoprotein LptE [Luteimonas sp.]|nr:LPS assembly lipoprotein LptE [Luteimonas sp.]
MIKHALAIVLVLALSACGFHLRDALLLPPDLGPLRVQSRDPYSPLAESLSQALARAGATPAAEGVTAGVATLALISEKWGNTPLSVDAFGRAQEFTLRYAVDFRLTRADGSVMVPEQALELTRDYVSVATKSAGTDSEREILANDLRREMVSAILRRIDAVSRTPAASTPAPAPTP